MTQSNDSRNSSPVYQRPILQTPSAESSTEDEEERAAIGAMARARADRTDFVTGEELRDGALAYPEEHGGRLMRLASEGGMQACFDAEGE